MTPIPYQLEGYQSSEDGKYYGKLTYCANVISSLVEGNDRGVKTEKDLANWARSEAHFHKAAISPVDTHVVRHTFVV